EELTTLVHGSEQTQKVVAASRALFGKGDLANLDEPTLDAAMAEAPTAEVRLTAEPSIVDLLVETGLAQGKSDARRVVKEGGAYVNNEKVGADTWIPRREDLLAGDWLVIRRGKRHTAGARVFY